MKTDQLVLRPIQDAGLLAQWEDTCFYDPWPKQSLQAQLHNPYTRAFALELAGKSLGYALFQIIEGEGELLRIAFWPGVRNQGWGSKIMPQLLEALEKEGLQVLFLEVRADNAAAIKLYLGAGFRYEGRRISYYRDGCDALLLYWKKEDPDESEQHDTRLGDQL